MVPFAFVGREIELYQLRQALISAAEGKGSTILIEASAGMGKSALLTTLEEVSKQNPALSNVKFVYGYCYEDTGTQNSFQPFSEFLSGLVNIDKKRGGLIQTIISETGPDWLQIIPGIGPGISAGIKSMMITGQWLADAKDNKLQQRADSMPIQFLNSIEQILKIVSPLVLVIEDCQWIDPSSTQLIFRLAKMAKERPFQLILTHRHIEASDHPFNKIRHELLIKDLARIINLEGLSVSHIESYILMRFGDMLAPNLADWLFHLSKGHPLFVSQFLSLLEQRGIITKVNSKFEFDGYIKRSPVNRWELRGAISNIPLPASVDALLEERIRRLLDEDQELLEVGSVQGDRFSSIILAETLDRRELDILSRLRRVVENHRLIYIYRGEHWAEGKSEVYAFEHVLLQQALYKKLSPREHLLYHKNTASILQKIIDQESTARSKALFLEIAKHYHLSDQYLAASQYYFWSAQASFEEAAYQEADELCWQALESYDHRAQAKENDDKLLSEIVLLIVMGRGVDARWAGHEKKRMLDVLEQGEQAAERSKYYSVWAQLMFLKGWSRPNLSKLSSVLETGRTALALAEKSENPLLIATLKAAYGQDLSKENLEAGISLRYEAMQIFEGYLRNQGLSQNSKAIRRQYLHIKSGLGVGEFDKGNLSTGYNLLNETVDALRQLKIHDELIVTLNYLSQAQMATGLYEEAEASLKEAIQYGEDEDQPNRSWHALNQATLGKVYLEWGKLFEAEELLKAGWEQTQRAYRADLTPLVRNYFAELLMHPKYLVQNLDAAESQLKESISDTRSTQMHRSIVQSLTLYSKLEIRRGNSEKGLALSQQAVDYIERMGDLPALRSEEVFFNHYLALSASNLTELARQYLRKALEKVTHKASSVNLPKHLESFWVRVELNAEIKLYSERKH